MNSVRRIAMLSMVSLLFLSISATTVGAQEKKVIVYTATAADVTDPIFAEFTADTGIQVEVVQAGTGVVWSRVRAEKENPLGDILYAGSDKMFDEAKAEDLFLAYQSPEDQYYSVRDPDGIWHGFGIPGGVQSFLVNTKLMPNEEDYPTSYRDFADIKYDGKIALLNPTYSGTGYITAQMFIHLAETEWGYEDGWDFLKKVMMNCKIYVSSGAARNAVRDGEIAMGVVGEAGYANMVKEEYAVYLLPMEEGYFGGLDAIAIVKGGPNPEEAKAFVDWFLSLKGQQMLADIKGDRAIRQGVTLSEDLYTYGFGDEFKYIDIPIRLFEDPDGFKKNWNGVMGEAVALKGPRDSAYAQINAAESSIKSAEATGRTVGLDNAKAKLADATGAFGEDRYEDAKSLATEALELAGRATAPTTVVTTTLPPTTVVTTLPPTTATVVTTAPTTVVTTTATPTAVLPDWGVGLIVILVIAVIAMVVLFARKK